LVKQPSGSCNLERAKIADSSRRGNAAVFPIEAVKRGTNEMNSWIKKSFVLPLAVAVLSSVLVDQVIGQIFTTLYNFSGATDGYNPSGVLILSSNTLYGTTEDTVFAVHTDGTAFTNLYAFTPINGYGANPQGLLLTGNTLYGTAAGGGFSWNGTVFKISTDGTGFTNLHSFTPVSNWYGTNSDGATPSGGLTLSDDALYGTASEGGSSGAGTVFKISIDGTGFTNLHTFTAPVSSFTNDFAVFSTNSDGANPSGGLILSGATLYGTTFNGGESGGGTVFKVKTNGTDFVTLHNFTGGDLGSTAAENPSTLLLSSNTLYGTSRFFRANGGQVFKLNTDGTGFTNLFTVVTDDLEHAYFSFTGLLLSGNTLYATWSEDVTWNNGNHTAYGALFSITTDGQGFTGLHDFQGSGGGGLILSGNTLYGAKWANPVSRLDGYGSLFSLSFQPQVTITPSVANVVVTWPTNYAGFDYTGYVLESTMDLGFSTWTTNLPYPELVNGQKSVTVLVTGTQQFFRLKQ
jgi:uncharacterized repeat protein (TIGR03803 family)